MATVNNFQSNGDVNKASVSSGVTTIDDHFEFFKQLCDRVNDYYVVQKAKNTYNSTKHSFGLLERTLDNVEGHAKDVLNYSAPVYENYVFPAANRLLGVYNTGIETSKSAMDSTKSIAITSGTLGIGLALVATQMGLIAGTTATNLFFDGFIATKNASNNFLNKAVDVEKYVYESIQYAIKTTFALAKNPIEKLNEHTNAFLDIANAVFEQILSLPKENEDPESKLTERVSFLTRRVARCLTASANAQFVEPCQRQLAGVLEQLQKSLVLVNYLKKQREWTFQQVDNLSSSVHKFRVKVEAEAKLAVTQPEDVLIRSIHSASKKLNETLMKLRESGAEVLNESVHKRLSSAISYIEQLDSNFVKADDIYQITDDVLVEAKQKLNEIGQWYK